MLKWCIRDVQYSVTDTAWGLNSCVTDTISSLYFIYLLIWGGVSRYLKKNIFGAFLSAHYHFARSL